MMSQAALASSGLADSGIMPPMKYWEIIADHLHAAGWSYGIAKHFTKHGLLFCVDAHRDGKRFIVKADDLLTAFLSLEKRRASAKRRYRHMTEPEGGFGGRAFCHFSKQNPNGGREIGRI
jgi:hypothetical protein